MRITHLTGVVLATFIAATTAMASGPAGDAARIQQLNERWLAMVEARDAPGIAALYAEDGRLMPPAAPTAVGRDAIRETWTAFLAAPALSFGSHGIHVADSGDMAYDTGWIEMTLAAADGGTQTARGKYVVVWEKRDGRWQVAVDILNMDGPG